MWVGCQILKMYLITMYLINLLLRPHQEPGNLSAEMDALKAAAVLPEPAYV